MSTGAALRARDPKSHTVTGSAEKPETLCTLHIDRFLADGPSGQVAVASWAKPNISSDSSKENKSNVDNAVEVQADQASQDSDQDGSSDETTSADSATTTGASSDMPFADSLTPERSHELLQEHGAWIDLPLQCAPKVSSQGHFAVKMIKLPTNVQENTQALAEIEIIRILSQQEHKFPLLVDLTFCAYSQGYVYVGMELCAGGDLFTLMYEHELELEEVLFAAAEIASGIQHLHDRGIVHGDIKPENIGLSAQGHIRILDFGLATHLTPEEHWDDDQNRLCVCTTSGTLFYSAPEILKREKHGCETDWWSFAVVLFEMYYSCWPWCAENDQDTCNLICAGPLEFPHDNRPFVPELNNFFHQLFRKEPSRRLCHEAGLASIKAHPLFNFVNWDLVASEGYQAPLSFQAQ